MFVKIFFIFLFTIGIADYVNSTGVPDPPANLNITTNSSETSTSTVTPSDVTTTNSNKASVTQITVTVSPEVEPTTALNVTHTEPVLINHNRTDVNPSVTSTLKPSSTTTVQPTKTPAHDAKSDASEHDDHVTTAVPVFSTDRTTTEVATNLHIEEKENTTKTTAAGIVALVCGGIVLVAIVSLFAVRYFYRRRHGNREILVNEEDVDFNDEDLRHFEATCIQLEPDA